MQSQTVLEICDGMSISFCDNEFDGIVYKKYFLISRC